jgi:hypothetical protein
VYNHTICTDHSQETVIKNIFAQLELRFGLLRETTPKYTNYQYKELRQPADNTPAGESIRKASKKAKTWTHIDVDVATQIKGVPRQTIIAKLNDWNERSYIKLDAKGVENVYLVLKPLPTTVQDCNALADSVYKELEIREQQDLARMSQVTDLITGQQCFALSLAKHFGDGLPQNSQECGHCTWCETHRPVELKKPPQKPWDSKAFFSVLSVVPDRDDPRFLARVAFGISSPRLASAKLSKNNAVFGCMEDCSFVVCLTMIPLALSPDTYFLFRHCLMHSQRSVRRMANSSSASVTRGGAYFMIFSLCVCFSLGCTWTAGGRELKVEDPRTSIPIIEEPALAIPRLHLSPLQSHCCLSIPIIIGHVHLRLSPHSYRSHFHPAHALGHLFSIRVEDQAVSHRSRLPRQSLDSW